MSNPASTPSIRATQAREALLVLDASVAIANPHYVSERWTDLIPGGSIILTAKEARLISSAVRGYPPGEIREQALALLAGGRNPA